ncbi:MULTISPECIES: MFS transporter [Paraburkholderia]|uniref:MFS transporter n=1 Tax=Paraburkholderia TaxID=1822464 RepID=UPI0005AAF2A0|nr:MULTISPECIES: MFS transporter [Paraburkholderia]PNE56660.1 MFS transporter [Paraburkholderia fungorum]USU14493.1 MFS transporter [Paraburkholderia fungorum]USU22441.1 MFS transporter [Paraburkholderia fungorum]
MSQHIRYEVIGLIFLVMSINQADRATMSIASTPMSAELHLNHLQLGWMFSAFAWAYMLFQIAGGWALDRFGARRTYTAAIMLWSVFTAAVAFAPMFSAQTASALIFALVFLIGVAAAPCFPANSKIVSAWFPTAERGTASAIFNATQYFAAAVFTPLLALLAVTLGWRSIYYVMGGIGIAAGLLFGYRMKSPSNHPRLTREEREVMVDGGATLHMEGRHDQAEPQTAPTDSAEADSTSRKFRRLLGSRKLLGIYFAQYCISTLTFFFLTWFPVYLVQARHLPLLRAGILASVPAVCGFLGGILGGLISDWLLRRGHSLTISRKIPIYAGMLMSSAIIGCNYVNVDWLVVALMAVAFFGKGFGALGWAVIADTSPVNATGLNAAVFNTFSSLAGITTPIAIGFLVQTMDSFDGALVYVGVHALLAIVSYAFVVGPIRRMEPV